MKVESLSKMERAILTTQRFLEPIMLHKGETCEFNLKIDKTKTWPELKYLGVAYNFLKDLRNVTNSF